MTEVEPAGAVAPLGHAVHDVAEPPAEYVVAAHCAHELPLRYEPAEHVDDDASARVNEAPEYVSEPSDEKRKMYDEEAGSVDTAGIEEPDHIIEVQPLGVVTQKES